MKAFLETLSFDSLAFSSPLKLRGSALDNGAKGPDSNLVWELGLYLLLLLSFISYVEWPQSDPSVCSRCKSLNNSLAMQLEVKKAQYTENGLTIEILAIE